jgi:hypothetical protein
MSAEMNPAGCWAMTARTPENAGNSELLFPPYRLYEANVTMSVLVMAASQDA